MKVVFFAVALLCAVSVCASFPCIGTLYQEQNVYKLNATAVDPNKVTMWIERRKVTVNVQNPQTFTVDGIPGKNIQNVTFTLVKHGGRLELESFYNTPGTMSVGVLSKPVVSGYWRGPLFGYVLSYEIAVTDRLRVSLRFFQVGLIYDGVFVGKSSGVNVAYAPASAQKAYQIVVTEGHIDSSLPNQYVIAYYAVGPYGTPANPAGSPAPYWVTGSAYDMDDDLGYVRGVIDFYSGTGAVNVTGASFYGYQGRFDDNLYINLGMAKHGNVSYLLDSVLMRV